MRLGIFTCSFSRAVFVIEFYGCTLPYGLRSVCVFIMKGGVAPGGARLTAEEKVVQSGGVDLCLMKRVLDRRQTWHLQMASRFGVGKQEHSSGGVQSGCHIVSFMCVKTTRVPRENFLISGPPHTLRTKRPG